MVSGEKNPRRGRREICLELPRERETPIRLNFIRGSFGLGVDEMHQRGGATLREIPALFITGIVHHLTEDFHGQPTLYYEIFSLKFCKKKQERHISTVARNSD